MSTTPITFKRYLSEAYEEGRYVPKHRDCIIAPMGAGKTYFIEQMLRDDYDKGVRSALVEPFKSIVDNKEDGDQDIMKGYKFTFSEFSRRYDKPIMTTVDTFVHLIDSKDYDRIYFDEPQYTIEHHDIRIKAFEPLIELLNSDDIEVIGLTGTSNYLEALGFNLVHFKREIPLIPRKIDYIIAKHTNATIVNHLITQEKKHEGFRSYRIQRKPIVKESVVKSWKLGQPAVGVHSIGKLADGAVDPLIALNRDYINLHGGDAETIMKEIRSGVFRGSVSVFHTGIFDSGVDFTIDQDLIDNNKVVMRIIGDSIANKKEQGGGRMYYAPMFNVVSQYFARVRNPKEGTPEDFAKIYPKLEYYGGFCDRSKPIAMDKVAKYADEKESHKDRIEYLSRKMQDEMRYSFTDWKNCIEAEGNYKVEAEDIISLNAKKASATKSSGYIYSHIWQSENFANMKETCDEEVLDSLLDMEKAHSGVATLNNEQLSSAEEMANLLHLSITKGISMEWYYSSRLRMDTLQNILEFLEALTNNKLLYDCILRKKITREEWNSFSKHDKSTWSQCLTRFFKCNGQFFKGSKAERIKTLNLSMTDSFITLPNMILDIYESWERMDSLKDMSVSESFKVQRERWIINKTKKIKYPQLVFSY